MLTLKVFISYAMQLALVLISLAVSIPWKSVSRSILNNIKAIWHMLPISRRKSCQKSHNSEKRNESNSSKFQLTQNPKSAAMRCDGIYISRNCKQPPSIKTLPAITHYIPFKSRPHLIVHRSLLSLLFKTDNTGTNQRNQRGLQRSRCLPSLLT